MRRRPTGFPGNARPHTTVVFGLHPIAAHTEAVIDEQCGLGMTPLSGTPRIAGAMSGVIGNRFSGDCGPLQDFRGGAFVGKSAANIRYRPNIGLPSTSGPAPAGLSPVSNLLRQIAEQRVAGHG
jgi:hypothetical protein